VKRECLGVGDQDPSQNYPENGLDHPGPADLALDGISLKVVGLFHGLFSVITAITIVVLVPVAALARAEPGLYFVCVTENATAESGREILDKIFTIVSAITI